MSDAVDPRAALRFELRLSESALGRALAVASGEPHAPLDALSEALHARCVTEEQLLLPALDEAGERAAVRRWSFEIGQLREALATLEATPPAAPERQRGLRTLEWMAVLHLGAVGARLLGVQGIDAARLAEGLAERRARAEAAAAGQPAAEDEEADPVGLPPR